MILKYKSKICPVCNMEFEPKTSNQKYCCYKCREQIKIKDAEERRKIFWQEVKDENEKIKKKNYRKKPKQTVVDVAVLARQHGMTYGQYVAQMYRRGEET